MLINETAGLEEVAASLGRSPAWLRRNWLKLHLEHAFPRKLPHAFVWPRGAVAAWLRAGGMGVEREPGNDNQGGMDFIAAAAAALRQRYGASA